MSKVAPTPQCPPPTRVSPKAIDAMAHVSRRVSPKKQQPSSTIERLRELNKTDNDEDGLVFRKCKAAPTLVETHTPHVKKVKPTQASLPPTQPCTNKREKRGAQRTKHPAKSKLLLMLLMIFNLLRFLPFENRPQLSNGLEEACEEKTLFTLRKREELSPMMIWMMKFHIKHLHHHPP